MRGLWWKTWRETWLPTEVAMAVCTLGAYLGLAWARTRPWFEEVGMEGVYFYTGCGYLCGAFLVLAASDAPSALGLDARRRFLLSKPRRIGALTVPFVLLLSVHILVAYMGVMWVTTLAPRPPRDVWWYLWLLWCVSWLGALGAIAAGDELKAVWISFTVGVGFIAYNTLDVAVGWLAEGKLLAATYNADITLLDWAAAAALPVAVLLQQVPAFRLDRAGWRQALAVVPVAAWLGVHWVDLAYFADMDGGRPHHELHDEILMELEGVAAEHTLFTDLVADTKAVFGRNYGHRDRKHLGRADRKILLSRLETGADTRLWDAAVLANWRLMPVKAARSLDRHPEVLEPVLGSSGYRGIILPPYGGATFFSPLRDNAMFQFIDRVRKIGGPPARGWAAFACSFTYGVAPTYADRVRIVERIAAWPEWKRGENPFGPDAESRPDSGTYWPMNYTSDTRLWEDLRTFGFPTPAWAQERPWLHVDPEARMAHLRNLLPFQAPPGLAFDLETLLASAKGLPGTGSWQTKLSSSPWDYELIWLSMLAPQRIAPALEARWRAFPAQRNQTLADAVRYAPALPLRWLEETPHAFAPAGVPEMRRKALLELFTACLLASTTTNALPFYWRDNFFFYDSNLRHTPPPAGQRVAWPAPSARHVRMLVQEMGSAASLRERQRIGYLLEAVTGELRGWDTAAWQDVAREISG